MSSELQDLLGGGAGAKAPVVPTTPAAPAAAPPSVAPTAPADSVNELVCFVREIQVEAVVGGVLQRITFGGCNPALVKPMLLAFDPSAQVRDAFPVRSSFGGNRDTKTARVMVISVRVTDSGKFWDIVAQNGEDLSISVSKKMSDDIVNSLAGLNKIGEAHITKLKGAIDGKSTATVILAEAEQIGAKYWKTDDGKAFLDSFVADAPAGEVKS